MVWGMGKFSKCVVIDPHLRSLQYDLICGVVEVEMVWCKEELHVQPANGVVGVELWSGSLV